MKLERLDSCDSGFETREGGFGMWNGKDSRRSDWCDYGERANHNWVAWIAGVDFIARRVLWHWRRREYWEDCITVEGRGVEVRERGIRGVAPRCGWELWANDGRVAGKIRVGELEVWRANAEHGKRNEWTGVDEFLIEFGFCEGRWKGSHAVIARDWGFT